MAWLDGLFERRATSQVLGHPRDPVLAKWLGVGMGTASGMAVTPDTALRVSAVYASVRLLAKTLASLPLVIYRRLPDGGKERDGSHPLWSVLHDAPNRRQTSFEWREMMIGHMALRGSAYSRIVTRSTDGAAVELMPLHPDRLQPFEAPDGRVAYRYMPNNGSPAILLDNEVLRFPDMSQDGIETMSPIAMHRETIGLAMAAQEYGARFFGNNASPKGGLKIPQPIGDEAAAALRDSWERRHKGVENAHRLAIMDAGMEWVQIGLSNEDAQYLEARQFQVTEIARIFGVPPHKIADLTRSTNNNIEHQAIEFVGDTVVPLTRRLEDRLNRSLLTEAGRRTHFIGFEVKGLLRGDTTGRSNLYRALFNVGAITPNEIRALEDMNAMEGGDEAFVPLNMAPASKALEVLMKKGAAAPDKPKENEDGA